MKRKHLLDVNFINPFLTGVMEVLRTMAMTVADPEKPYIKETDYAKGDITGFIGLTGHVKGSISVTFSKDCAVTVVGNMLGEDLKEIDDTVKDGVGELTNMISGQARQGLAQLGYKLHAAIPLVIVGKGHMIQHVSDFEPVLAMPFTTLFGPITVEACFAKPKN